MTFTRNMEGSFVEKKVTFKSVAEVAVKSTMEIIEVHAKLFHGLLELLIKIGLTILLLPWIKIFLLSLYTTLGAI